MSATPEVCVLDFGMGNLRNVCRALERAGAKPDVSQDPTRVLTADRLVFPGVGSCADTLRSIRAHGLDQALCERIAAARPSLGICVGMQVLLETSQEGRPERGLGVIAGRVERFPDDLDLAVPHMGWNHVELTRPHPVLRAGYFYFVHGYRPVGVPSDLVLATTEYGSPFASAIGRDAVAAVQFHPEKSQTEGLGLFLRFLRWCP